MWSLKVFSLPSVPHHHITPTPPAREGSRDDKVHTHATHEATKGDPPKLFPESVRRNSEGDHTPPSHDFVTPAQQVKFPWALLALLFGRSSDAWKIPRVGNECKKLDAIPPRSTVRSTPIIRKMLPLDFYSQKPVWSVCLRSTRDINNFLSADHSGNVITNVTNEREIFWNWCFH